MPVVSIKKWKEGDPPFLGGSGIVLLCGSRPPTKKPPSDSPGGSKAPPADTPAKPKR